MRWRFAIKYSECFGVYRRSKVLYEAGEEIEIRLIYTRDEVDYAVIRKPGQRRTAVEVPVTWIKRIA